MSTNGKTVLLVEDNEDNRIVYSTILRHFGYSVTEALNGEEGIAKARSEKPDLILMDISIPIIDGWEATQVLKHDPDTRDIPIIALTAHALASDREKAKEVGSGRDGTQALERVHVAPPDLILLDVMMPTVDGNEVARRIKQNPALPFIPIIMQTALDSTESKVEGLEAGADDYITKPIEFAELKARIRSMLRIKRLQEELEERERQLLEANERLR